MRILLLDRASTPPPFFTRDCYNIPMRRPDAIGVHAAGFLSCDKEGSVSRRFTHERCRWCNGYARTFARSPTTHETIVRPALTRCRLPSTLESAPFSLNALITLVVSCGRFGVSRRYEGRRTIDGARGGGGSRRRERTPTRWESTHELLLPRRDLALGRLLHELALSRLDALAVAVGRRALLAEATRGALLPGLIEVLLRHRP